MGGGWLIMVLALVAAMYVRYSRKLKVAVRARAAITMEGGAPETAFKAHNFRDIDN